MKKTLIIYQTLSGNTETCVPYLQKHFESDVIKLNKMRNDINFSKYDNILIGCFTWNDGKIPARIKRVIIENSKSFEGKNVLVFGSGNSIYANFCGAVENISKIMLDCNVKNLAKMPFEQRFHADEQVDVFINEVVSMFDDK